MGLDLGTVLGGIGGFLIGGPGGASVGMSLGQSSAADRDARAAAKARGKIAKLENLRTVTNTIREARVARAQVIAGAEASGMGAGSSAVEGGLSSLESQLFGNLDYLSKSNKLNSVANAAEIRASQASSNAYAFGAAADLFGKIPGDLWNDIPSTLEPLDAGPGTIFQGDVNSSNTGGNA